MTAGWERLTGTNMLPSRHIPIGEVYMIAAGVVAHPTTIGKILAQLWCIANLKTKLRPRKTP